MSRRPSLRARLAAAGLDAERAEADLERADLLVEGDIDEELLRRLSEAASPSDALACVTNLAVDHPQLARDVLADVEWLTRVIAVAGASRPLGDLLARHADATRALETLDHVEVAPIARAVAAAVRRTDDPGEQSAGIATIRRAATADIAARDLTGVTPVEGVASELSNLAEGVLTGAIEGVHAQVVGSNSPSARIGVIGMGKLGGQELNYVSDVDVMFVHEVVEGASEDEASREVRQTLTTVLELLNTSTTMGRAYEVDPTLRPEGRSGALSRTIPAFVAYWERWAKTWEFQALLKARPVAGDRSLGARFLAAAEPFVWPERLEPDVVAEIRAMKSRIESKPEVVRDGDRQIKLGPGGIRDVEFAVQLLQLVHGRGDRSLRCTGTLETLDALAANGYVDEEDAAHFADAYRLLRTVEHRLQLAHERRTHTVPEDPDDQEWIARAVGYQPSGEETARVALLRDLRRTQAQVRELHAKLFYRPLLERYASTPAAAAEVSVPHEVTAMGEAAAQERLEVLGFRDGRAALRDVRALTGGISRRARTVRAVLPAVLQVLQDTPDPDAGMAAFRSLIESQSDNGELLAYLRDHPDSAQLLGRVLGTSPVAGELLAGQPQGIEWLRDASLRDRPRDRDELVRMALSRMHWQDTTAALRRLKRLELLRLVLRDLSGGATIGGVGEELTALAEACLVGALTAELQAQADRLGVDGPDALGVRIAIIGMGKLGGRELQYASDLDVLFVHEAAAGVDDASASRIALDVAANVMRSLSAITAEGTAFDVDADLRPEGKSGPLSRSLASYRTYWERWAEPWEHQALLRVRAVAGDGDLGTRFVEAAHEHAYPPDGDDEAAAQRMAAMRQMKARLEKERIPRRIDAERHLKLGPGGLSDVEWTVQLLQQRHGVTRHVLRTPSTMAALDALQDAELLEHRDAAWMRDGYRFLTRVRNHLYLLRQRDTDVVPSSPRTVEVLARSLGYSRGGWQDFEEEWRRHTRHVRQVCEREFYGIDPTIRRGGW
ncbi:MAG: bifunctional [glutamine synthetase] adenylyltransferase/[glutamine synthetase]-adenylyl-L-tyrosine phosphorylase [Nitriliruptoraceae bacterium]